MLLTIEYYCSMDSLKLKLIQTAEAFEEKKKQCADIANNTVNDIARNYYKGKAEAYTEARNELMALARRLMLPA